MRYYLPLREKSVQGKRQAPSRMLPLWVWLLAIACLLLIVLALR
jgi:type VI protein secretion system component VasF